MISKMLESLAWLVRLLPFRQRGWVVLGFIFIAAMLIIVALFIALAVDPATLRHVIHNIYILLEV